MILDRNEIRKDVLEIIDESQKIQKNAIYDYIRKHENEAIDFHALIKKIFRLNEVFFKKKEDAINLASQLTQLEKSYMAKLHRQAYEVSSNFTQQNNPLLNDVELETIKLGSISAEWQIFPKARENKALLYFHGGGYIMGSPNTHRLLTVSLGKATDLNVLSLEYRLGPENKYPSFLEDALSSYHYLVSEGIDPRNIIISGDSAGGHLTLITLLKLKEKGIDLPAGAITISPLTDMTMSGKSFYENAKTDPILADIGLFWWVSAAFDSVISRYELSNSNLSPLFADLKGLPPLLFQASSNEMLYDDSVRFVKKARKAGVKAKLQAWNDMPHVFQLMGLGFLPESKDAIEKIATFTRSILN